MQSTDKFKLTEHGDRSVVLTPVAKDHLYTLIFLHGLGDSAHGFTDVFMDMEIVPDCFKVILPTAPRKPVSCNKGYVMNSWFDIYSLKSGNSGVTDPTQRLQKIQSEYC